MLKSFCSKSVHVVSAETASVARLCRLLLLLLVFALGSIVCCLQLFVQNLVDLLRSHADRLVAGLHQALHLRSQDNVLTLIELDRVLRLDEGPVDALQHPLLNRLFITLQRADQILHVSLNEEDLTLLFLTLCIELQHLDQALASLLDDGDLVVLGEELYKYVKVAKNVVDVACNLTFPCLDDLIEATQQVMVDIEEQLYAPLFLVRQHGLDQLVRLVNDSKLSQLSE